MLHRRLERSPRRLVSDQLAALVGRHGATSKLVRAYCAAMGWRYSKTGAPAEWYRAWRDGLGQRLDELLRSRP